MNFWQWFKQLWGTEPESVPEERPDLVEAEPQIRTPESLSPEKEEQVKAILHAFFEARDNWVCWCGQPIEEEEQVGRSVYYRPCGHRMGQGIARGKNPNLTIE